MIAAWAAYLDVTGASPATVRAYRRSVVNFLADLPHLLDVGPTGVTEDDVARYVRDLPARGSKRNDVLKALRSLYAYLDEDVPVNPVRRLAPKNPRRERKAPNLSDEEVVRLLVALAWVEPRRAWTFLLLFSTGARIGSACALTAEDCRGPRIHFRVAKGDRPYSVPRNRIADEALRELARGAGDGPLIGVTPTRVRQWFEQATKATGIKLHPHLLRHAYLARIARVADQRTWMDLANHLDLSQFGRYTAEDEQLQEHAVAEVFG